MIEVWVFTRGIMRALRNYEIDNFLPAPRRRRGERSGQLTNAVLSYFSARRLCKCNHIVSHDEIILDNGVPLESCIYLRIGFNKKICISVE